ncbi:MAG TPA: 2-C-methyl-D-erythritol 2,4-cyclodiphosphate synthase [Candidatus Alistipes merdigallinarum]|nr:2-C-methyl-D-erythritol 2,4-cyclodiphosphate synthase [Candidatus Alistipes merdigallinarum]
MTPFRIGHGYDVHALGPGLPLWLGGVRVAHTHGCIAHSDGDVLIHALCDALLGAAALGDIGTHFPDTSSEFRNIDSKILLKRTVALLSAQGYAVGNVDCTLCMQRPKIKPYIPAMRKALSEAMDISEEAISIKATTTEHLGFTGREEGVEAHAVALIYRLERKTI